MANKISKPQEEPPGVGEWIVTFSDCMTLLLCFFVLLLTFSSFDDAAMNRFGGAFNFDNQDFVIINTKLANDSMIKPTVHLQDYATAGSETPTDHDIDKTEGSRKPDSMCISDDDAYRDKKVIRIPSKKLFIPDGNALSDDGRKSLAMMASFMRQLPCRVIISEATGWSEYSAASSSLRTGLSRAWTIVDYLTVVQGLPAERFNVSASHLDRDGKASLRRGASVEIVLLAKKVYE